MILETAVLQIKPGQREDFERSFLQASGIIASMKGYLGHELQQCLEDPDQYLLLVHWETLEDHEIGFRQSNGYLEWKRLLHHYYDPFPTVHHYSRVYGTEQL